MTPQPYPSPLVNQVRVIQTASTQASDTPGARGAGGGAVDTGKWITKLATVDPDAAFAVRGCGTYGRPRILTGRDGRHRLSGGLCKRGWDCPDCASRQAALSTQQLSELVHYLTAREGFKPSQFLFATLTMRSSMGTTRDRVEAMGAALTKLMNQRWFKRDVLGYEMAWDLAGSLTNPAAPWINAHLHGLWIVRDGVDCEDLKQRVFDFLKRELGDLIGWDESSNVWRKTLEPAILSPGLGRYIHGHVWRGSHEVGATVLKGDKQRGAYKNHFDRQVVDLAEIQPLIRAQLLRVRRGGIVSKVRQLLTLRDDIHQDASTAEQHQVPPHYRHASSAARAAFRQLVEDPWTSPQLLHKLVTVPADVPVERWESVVLERGTV